MDITQIIGLVDGFLTLAVLLFFTHLHRKDIADLKKDINELKKDSLAAQDKHISDLKESKNEYAKLLERVLTSLNETQDFIKDHIVGLKESMRKQLSDFSDKK